MRLAMFELSGNLWGIFLPVLKACRLEIQLLAVSLVFSLTPPALAQSLKLEWPVKCELGVDCFLQNYSDLVESKKVLDPWCGEASYDGHKGTDIRVLSMADIARNVAVIAGADGAVKGVRDGMPDRLVRSDQDRDAVKNKECGNGVLIDHGNGFETQYCHMKQGSVVVKTGSRVRTGDVLGYIGNSGLAQFPHVHVTLRKNGQWLDILTGSAPSRSCKPFDTKNGYLSKAAIEGLPVDTRQLLASGITGQPIKHDALVINGVPSDIVASDKAIVGWGWFINLAKGDVISLEITGPGGFSVRNEAKPLEKQKASYSAFAGRRVAPMSGTYLLKTLVSNGGKTVLEESREVIIR
ncbi:MAG: M23 family metallopeptidase [Pseudomonadota bacterium]